MGAGHDGAANELRAPARAPGPRGPRSSTSSTAARSASAGSSRSRTCSSCAFAPWSYDLTYRLWYKLPSTWGFIVRLDTFVAGKRLRRAITRDRRRRRRVDVSAVVARARQHAQEALAEGPGHHLPHRLRGAPALGAPARRRAPRHEPVRRRHRARRVAATTPARPVRSWATGSGPRDAPDRARRPAPSSASPTDARGVLVVAGSWGVGDITGHRRRHRRRRRLPPRGGVRPRREAPGRAHARAATARSSAGATTCRGSWPRAT